MPFLTEELWHDELFGSRNDMDCCIVAQLPAIGEINAQLIAEVEVVQQLIAQVRNIRNSKQLSPKEALPLAIKVNSAINYDRYTFIIKHLANISEIEVVNEALNGVNSFICGTDEFFVTLNIAVDAAEETARLQKEKDYLIGFLKSVNAKLSNERFVANAKPEIVENEQKKRADAEAKLKIIEDNLAALAG
jgi:valyl-tRNA synthetase